MGKQEKFVTLVLSAEEAQQLADLVHLVDGTGPHCATGLTVGFKLRDAGFIGRSVKEVSGRIICR